MNELKNKPPFYLTSAIEEAFGPDPHLGAPDPGTVEAVALLVLQMAAVSKARRPSLAKEPWKEKSAKNHIVHSFDHVSTIVERFPVGETAITDGFLDDETKLPNLAHSSLRAAFALRLLSSELGL